MARYTPDQFDKLLDKVAKGLPKTISEAGLLAANELRGMINQRIFNNGKADDGSLIGEYSTKATLIGSSSFPNKTAANKVLGSKRKRRKLEWVSYKGHNLAVLEGGYKAIRNISGLRIDTVDLNFKGDLQKSFGKIEQSKNIYTLRIKGKDNVTKARANEKRFKGSEDTIFDAGTKEEKIAQEVYREHIEKYLDKFFD